MKNEKEVKDLDRITGIMAASAPLLNDGLSDGLPSMIHPAESFSSSVPKADGMSRSVAGSQSPKVMLAHRMPFITDRD